MLSSYAAQAAAWEASQQQQQQQQQQPIIKEQNVHEILADQYEQLVKKYAKYESYRISIRDDNNEWTIKTFRHHKITSADYEKAKLILESPDEYSEPTDDEEEIEDSDDFELVIQHYKFLASCYLHMSSEQFENCDWGKTRLVLDACNYRTVHTLVGSEGIYEFFHLENAKGEPVTSQLTKRGHDYLEMYRLWKTLKITPWRKKGTMYEEDINILLRVDEQFNSGQKHKQKKESAHANKGENGSGMRGPDGVLHKRKTTYKNR